MNQTFLLGNITKDIELKETQSGVKYTRFSIAVKRNFKNENGEYDTDFFNIVAWRKTAEFISEYFSKGKRIAISGRLQNNKYTDKDGVERISTEIVVNEFSIIEKRQKENDDTEKNNNSNEDIYAEFGEQIEISDDEISF